MNLKLLRNGEKVDQVVYGKDYVLRADISHPDGKHDTCNCYQFEGLFTVLKISRVVPRSSLVRRARSPTEQSSASI